MVVKRVNDSWQNFPYRKDFEDGASNNGGFNLVENPAQIDLITEFENLPEIKKAVYQLNIQNTPFMTTGFLFDREDEHAVYHGYIEFCFRPSVNYSSIDIYKLDEMFISHTLEVIGKQFADFYQTEFLWEIREGSVQQSSLVPIYCVFFRARNHAEAELELVPLLNWLQSSFQHLVKQNN